MVSSVEHTFVTAQTQLIFKRLTDIAISAGAVIGLAPVFIVVALAIKAVSRSDHLQAEAGWSAR
jgi:lipopolysaccharide/colanic/teichoic acid biosynthesis glycosyltransferase